MRRPFIADKQTEIVVGSALLVVAFLLLYDAWDGRGGQKPRVLGPILPW